MGVLAGVLWRMLAGQRIVEAGVPVDCLGPCLNNVDTAASNVIHTKDFPQGDSDADGGTLQMNKVRTGSFGML